MSWLKSLLYWELLINCQLPVRLPTHKSQLYNWKILTIRKHLSLSLFTTKTWELFWYQHQYQKCLSILTLTKCQKFDNILHWKGGNILTLQVRKSPIHDPVIYCITYNTYAGIVWLFKAFPHRPWIKMSQTEKAFKHIRIVINYMTDFINYGYWNFQASHHF